LNKLIIHSFAIAQIRNIIYLCAHFTKLILTKMKLTLKRSILTTLILSSSILIFSCKKETHIPTRPLANAGDNQTIQLPKSSLTLIGSGTTHNGNITGYLWSLVSGPNVPVITQPSSATTSITDFIAGTYIFQLLVTDDAGLTDVDTTTVVVNAAETQVLTLQPSNNNDERHLFGNGTTIDNSTHATELDAATWTTGGETVFVRGILKFDLTSIPSNATIISAKLSLYSNPTPLNGNLVDANYGTNNSMFIKRITTSWDPLSTFWNNQPSTTAVDQVSIPHTDQSFLDLIDLDVKNLVAAMVSNTNYGFQLSLQNEAVYNIRDFCSSTYSNATKHPKLVITYQP
jgi:hypothetical protein